MPPGENDKIERALAEGLISPQDVEHARGIQQTRARIE
jgi:hypothetical protein